MLPLAQVGLGSLATIWIALPGWFIARRCKLPHPWLVGFLAGAALLSTLVWIIPLVGGELTRGPVVGAWLAITLGAALTLLARPPQSAVRLPEKAPSDQQLKYVWLAILPVAAVVIWRVTQHPLFGIDTSFRWNYLAELMLSQKTLDFYPPSTGAHYSLYPWPDGISPLVSSLYFFSYVLAGSPDGLLTAPVIFAQLYLLFYVVRELATQEFSAGAGTWAMTLLAATPMAIWAGTMGQETGITAIGLMAMLLLLPKDRAAESSALLVAAGIAAAVGALAREYGWAFLPLGVVLCWQRKLSRRGILLFLVTGFVVAAPWYARNAVQTGNLFFNLDVAGLLPVNAPHVTLMAIYRDNFGFAQTWRQEAMTLPLNCGAALIGLFAGAVVFRGKVGPLLGVAVIVALLWMASVAYTAAAFTYSLRVLSPLLAIGAVLGGGVCAHFTHENHTRRVVLALFLTLVCAESAVRILVLPYNPHIMPVADWPGIDSQLRQFQNRPIYARIAEHTGSSGILTFGPHVELIRAGTTMIPTWSPTVGFLFNQNTSPQDCAVRLRSQGIRYFVLSRSTINNSYLALSPFFREARNHLRLVMTEDEIALYEIAIPAS